MNSETIQTRLHLQAMRPNGQDNDNPALVEALRQTGLDPGLRQWFEREQAFDRAFAEALASVPPPAALHVTILAGAYASRRASRWRRFGGAALAAGAAVIMIAAMAGLGLRQKHSATDALEVFRAGMIRTLEWPHQLDHKTPRAEDARVWLASHEGIADADIPPGLCGRETIGCKVFEWHGAMVTLICFKPCPSGNPQSASAHLFVVDEKDTPELLAVQAPLFAETRAWTSAAWRQNGKIHLLLSRSAMPHLQSLFDG